MPEQLTLDQAKAIVNEAHALSRLPSTIDIIGSLKALFRKLEAGGWRLGIKAYSSKVERASRGRRLLLRHPRNEWRVVAWWVKGDEKVWYYNQKADSKARALDMQERNPMIVPVADKLSRDRTDGWAKDCGKGSA